jgi:hypothetical protein
MSIGLMLEYAASTKSGDFVPIATEAAFHKYWQPGCAALHLQWVPLFQTGLPLRQEDISLVIDELVRLKHWFSCQMETVVPQMIILRIEQLIQALQKVQGNPQVDVYIG